MHRLLTATIATFVLLLGAGVSPADAATIVVDTTADEQNTDGDCSLREAVVAAVANIVRDACPAGQPDPVVDRVTFGVTGTITLIGPLSVYVPFSSLSIEGPGAELLTISGGGTMRPFLIGRTGNVRLSGVTVSNGSAAAPQDGTLPGGGAILSDGTLNIVDSVFSGNVGGRTGGAIDSFGATSVAGSTFSANSATFGGAIHTSAGGLTVLNSTFAGNSAQAGGAIQHASAAPLNVTNATFTRNSAALAGGGGGINAHIAGASTLRNTIFADNPGGNCRGASTDGGGNLSWPDTTCPGVNVDPRLEPGGLQENGGPTPTIALLPDSPAIDGGVALSCPPIDQRGVARPQGAGCDIGAYELVTDSTPPVITAPAVIVVDASSPSGAVVAYSVSASDEIDGPVPVACAPLSGSTFPIGTTMATCTAVDAAGNEASATFAVHVKGSSEQVADLIALVDDYDLSTLGTSLQDKLAAVEQLLAADRSREACEKLGSFLNQVRAQSGMGLSVEQEDALTAAAQRIKVVIGC